MPGGFPGGSDRSGGGLPPPSPLLEAYHGTWQSLSPMPSPMLWPRGDDELEGLEPLDPPETRHLVPEDRRHRKKKHGHGSSSRHRSTKRVKIYDAEEDARDIYSALTARGEPATGALIDILPYLSEDQMQELRAAYKHLYKMHGRGINVAKHIKLKLPSNSNFAKISHATALGRWESEAHWANYWYQGSSSRRELLIEALMGRPNSEIRAIKAAFRDKRYGDSLTRCMEAELRRDKFRTAVLLALQAGRQDEGEVWSVEERNRDVDALAAAVRRREGGESDILAIVCTRSDAHLREVLRVYERKWQGNFAREVLRKSNNLVGEITAHILNGVINRPARDAMLLHHALLDIMETHNNGSSGATPRSSSLFSSSAAAPPLSATTAPPVSSAERQHRHELLISRLVRLHWDRSHMRRVRVAYREKYGALLEEDVEDATRGDFRAFCLGLVEG
ncbi:uncharacterized protein K452DRAFT_219871 [Aplosporella prunicola CBS 121167]|uniref:Annexin n=1 Tax=Aplosporella prunicola CBS 121167 TaxID=1176127 RepID=A0A6A6BQ87_9PEZI|nr:uncharacterized protein K452DRAFT_219871 [Aplosporella prunicola CBS 121167]KAF2146292.1 hypothetical protein K452DRAFT_219871 [Aplosporella prunicola CBS 121167]